MLNMILKIILNTSFLTVIITFWPNGSNFIFKLFIFSIVSILHLNKFKKYGKINEFFDLISGSPHKTPS